jgi:hypothetical protein
MNVWTSALLVLFLFPILFLLIAIILVWGFRRLSFIETPSSTLDLKEPRLPDWFVRGLTAVWPFELIFSCIWAPTVAIVVWRPEADLIILALFVVMLAGVVAYGMGFILTRSGWWLFPLDSGCEVIAPFVVLAFALAGYYILAALICRHIILPVLFHVADINYAEMPPIFPESRDVKGNKPTVPSVFPESGEIKDSKHMVPCPYCSKSIPNDVIHCEYCGMYVYGDIYNK